MLVKYVQTFASTEIFRAAQTDTFQGSGCLAAFLGSYPAFWKDYKAKQVATPSLVSALACVKLGAATAQSRVQQWRHELRLGFGRVIMPCQVACG